jgi:hypothetical protein
MKETKTACPMVAMVRFWDPRKQLGLSSNSTAIFGLTLLLKLYNLSYQLSKFNTKC